MLTIEIDNPQISPQRKFEAALEVLAKAFPYYLEIDEGAEETPYQALVDLTEEMHAGTSDRLYDLWKDICKNWLHTELDKAKSDRSAFKLRGKTFINPKTGKLLTVGQWKAIKQDLTRVLKAIYETTEEALVMRALAVGKILQSMSPGAAIDEPLDKLEIDDALRTVSRSDQYRNMIQFAKLHTGELIQDVTERSRKAIMRTILTGYSEQTSQQELARKLFDTFSVLNRDWRRIAETETSINFNNGYLLSELEAAKGERVFIKGISGAGACDFCRDHIDGQIFVLLAKPPDDGGDEATVDGATYTAIWPGKNNFGRKRAEWWVCLPSHPHCRCSGLRWAKINEKFESLLRTNMKK